ncbi:hypothetical protein [Runella zeae]|uniref:hypothetical protein n=1 Tax=Runella zeae TaxID=94255 RepID=UPI00040C5EF8|nr:hypothetical protein [Runella zeae]
MKNLTLNERINLRGMLSQFQKYAIKDWQEQLDKKVYRKRGTKIITKDGYQATRIRFRSGALRREWNSSLHMNSGLSTLSFKFPLHGRMVDMGVGKGISYTDQKYASSRFGRRIGDGVGRRPVKWIGKTKTFSQRRLAELLVKRYGKGLVGMVSDILTTELKMSL